jgi:hypothetical protein
MKAQKSPVKTQNKAVLRLEDFDDVIAWESGVIIKNFFTKKKMHFSPLNFVSLVLLGKVQIVAQAMHREDCPGLFKELFSTIGQGFHRRGTETQRTAKSYWSHINFTYSFSCALLHLLRLRGESRNHCWGTH